MSSNTNSKVAVIGAGSFGVAIANLLSINQDVLLFTRRAEAINEVNVDRLHKGQKIAPNIIAVSDREQICEECQLIFPMVSAANFAETIDAFAPFLKPHHFLIHGTKGLNLIEDGGEGEPQFSRSSIETMSELILSNSNVLRVGCLSGPNLAAELAEGMPAGTVIASAFDEVILAGKKAIKSDRFRVYGSHDLQGVELAGVLKNVLALASGMVEGLELGSNAKAMLLTRGLNEMVKLGQAMGSTTGAFLGIAGFGDLVATCSSPKSRNYRVGFNMAKGKSLEQVLTELNDTAEGVSTTRIAQGLINFYGLELPIFSTVYGIIYKQKPIDVAMGELMVHHYETDSEFVLS